MSGRGVLLAAGIAGAFLALALSASASWLRDDPTPGRSTLGRAAGAGGGVRIGGHVSGLYPGNARRLRVRVENRGRQPVTVQAIRAVVGDASRRCSASNIGVTSYRGRLLLPPYRRRWIGLRISMRADAADACQRARFPITYRARVSG